MELPERADVVVIGGGIVGCHAAFHLAKAGKNVVLCERRNVASGASGRNGGQIIQLDGRDSDADAIWARLRYSMADNKLLDELQEEFDVDLEVRRIGSLDLAYSEEEWDQIRQIYQVQTEAGDNEVELLDRKELRDRIPEFCEEVWGARFRTTDGNLNPFALTWGAARAAGRYGAAILTHTPVGEILVRNAAVQGVRTSRGVIETDTVLNAANGWAADVMPDLDVIPLRAVAIVTEPVPELSVVPFEAMLSGQVVYGTTQDAKGNIQVGGPPASAATRQGQFQERVSLKEVRGNVSTLTTLFPCLAGVHVIRCWAGTMGATADGFPCVGPWPRVKGLHVCAGFPNGMAFAPILSKLCAENILTGRPSMPLDPYAPGRFLGRAIDWPKEYNYTVLADFLARL